MSRDRVRQVVMWVIAADFPLLYVGGVTLESTAAAMAALVVMGAAAAVAVGVY